MSRAQLFLRDDATQTIHSDARCAAALVEEVHEKMVGRPAPRGQQSGTFGTVDSVRGVADGGVQVAIKVRPQ